MSLRPRRVPATIRTSVRMRILTIGTRAVREQLYCSRTAPHRQPRAGWHVLVWPGDPASGRGRPDAGSGTGLCWRYSTAWLVAGNANLLILAFPPAPIRRLAFPAAPFF